MSYWFGAKPKLSSLNLKKPGLASLLVQKTFLVNPLSALFHVGMVGVLITGIIMEILYVSSWGSILNGGGWVITWMHGGLGLLTAVGFMGVLARFAGSRSFRVASGRMFYVDAVLIGVIAVSGLDLLLRILGILPAASGWESTIHITATMVWLLVSLFGGGLVSHAVGTVAYRFTDGHSPAALQTFSSACSRCGKCVEVCPEYEASNGLPEQAPALKVRRYLKQFQDNASPAERKAIVEHVYACALCGLCVGVCPYAFRHYDLYMGLLRQVTRAQEGEEVRA